MELTAAAIRPALGRITPSAQLRSFVAIGLACTAAYALLYTLLRDAGMAALPANALALTLTMGANFAANRRYSFKASDGPLGSQLASYTVAYLLGLAASSIVLAVLLGSLGHPHGAADTAAALAAGVVATAIRYVLMRSWVFRPSVSQYEGTLPAPVERRADPFAGARESVRSLRMPRPELIALLVLAAVLNLWALGQNGWANEYYSAAVRSMSSSWHNFLFGSFDPSGVMTVDKPPMALWVQAASVRVFGFHPLSILVPQALMGMASVALVYDLTRRRFGRVAGAVAGLVLAVTPMTVAISRHNNPDALLVLCSVAALWFVVRALEDGRTRWLVLSGVCVGLGFETKMAVALMMVPGIVAAWLWVAPRGRITALRQLLAGGAAMIVVGGAWPLLVTLTPASSRPWISGTSDNSIWSLIFGYNGLGRLDGQAGGPQALGGGGGGGGFFGGSTGPLRLLNSALGGQAGWLLGVAVVGGIGVDRRHTAAPLRPPHRLAHRHRRGLPHLRRGVQRGEGHLPPVLRLDARAVRRGTGRRHRRPGDVRRSRRAHRRPTGRGGGRDHRADRAPQQPRGSSPGCRHSWSAAGSRPRWRSRRAPAPAPGSQCSPRCSRCSCSHRPAGRCRRSGTPPAAPSPRADPPRPPRWAARAASAADAAAPRAAARSEARPAQRPSAGGTQGGFGGGPQGAPSANGGPPTGAGFGGGPGGGGGSPFGGNSAELTQAETYVAQHGGGTIAVSSQQGAASAIITKGVNVAGIGGFSGRESQVTVKWLAQEIRSGNIRWVLVDGTGSGGTQDGRTGSSQVMAAVAQTCTKVSYSSSSSSGGTLYDCQGKADALLSAL